LERGLSRLLVPGVAALSVKVTLETKVFDMFNEVCVSAALGTVPCLRIGIETGTKFERLSIVEGLHREAF
jgi:hypothetical protein